MKSFRLNSTGLFAALLWLGTSAVCSAQSPTETLSENFESWDGTTSDWLPEGWTEINTNAEQAAMEEGRFTWHVATKRQGQTIPAPVEGSKFAIIYYAYATIGESKKEDLAQDEWLVSPVFTAGEEAKLTFQHGYSPLYLFDLNNENIDWGTWTFTNSKPSTTLKVMARETGGEWTELYDVFNEWKDYGLKDLFDNYSESSYHFTELSLEQFAGKSMQIAFRFVGKYGNTMEIDAVRVTGKQGGAAGIGKISAAAPEVTVHDGSIVVRGHVGGVTVYDEGGRQIASVQSRGAVAIPVPAGHTYLYIVKPEGKPAIKVRAAHE